MNFVRDIIDYCKQENDTDDGIPRYAELDYTHDGMQLPYTEENIFHVCIKHGHVEALELLL